MYVYLFRPEASKAANKGIALLTCLCQPLDHRVARDSAASAENFERFGVIKAKSLPDVNVECRRKIFSP